LQNMESRRSLIATRAANTPVLVDAIPRKGRNQDLYRWQG